MSTLPKPLRLLEAMFHGDPFSYLVGFGCLFIGIMSHHRLIDVGYVVLGSLFLWVAYRRRVKP